MGALGGVLFGLVIRLMTSRVLRQPRWFLPGSVLSSGLLGLGQLSHDKDHGMGGWHSGAEAEDQCRDVKEEQGHHDASELAIGRAVAGQDC